MTDWREASKASRRRLKLARWQTKRYSMLCARVGRGIAQYSEELARQFGQHSHEMESCHQLCIKALIDPIFARHAVYRANYEMRAASADLHHLFRRGIRMQTQR